MIRGCRGYFIFGSYYTRPGETPQWILWSLDQSHTPEDLGLVGENARNRSGLRRYINRVDDFQGSQRRGEGRQKRKIK